MPKFTAKLTEKLIAAQDTFVLKFTTILENDVKPFNPRPGSVVSVLVREKTYRSYSIMHSDKDCFYLLIAAKGTGLGSVFTNDLKIGQIVEMIGPSGKFSLTQNNEKNRVFIGTGTGMAPFFGFLDSYIKIKENKGKLLILSGLNGFDGDWFSSLVDEVLGEFDDQNLDKIETQICFFPSLEPAEDLELGEFNQTVTIRLKNLFKNNNVDKTWEFYLCGHPNMVADVESYLIEEEKTLPENIIKESFAAPIKKV